MLPNFMSDKSLLTVLSFALSVCTCELNMAIDHSYWYMIDSDFLGVEVVSYAYEPF